MAASQFHPIVQSVILQDESAFYDNLAAAAPVYIYGARCEPFPEYVKRKHAFRLAYF